jgi:hypothetical protein
MAQSASNLTISVGADTSLAKAELDALNAKIRQTRKEISDLTKAGGTKAGVDPAAINALTQAQAKNYQEQARLLPLTKANTKATQEQTKATVEGGQATNEFTKYLLEFGKEAGISNLSVRGLKLGLAGLIVAETIKSISDAIKTINELSIAAKETGATVGTIKGLESAFRAAGDSAANAAPLLKSFFEAGREARLRGPEIKRRADEAAAQIEAEAEIARQFHPPGAPPVSAGETRRQAMAARERVLREAAVASRFPSPREDPFGYFGIKPETYGQTEEEKKRFRQETAAAVLKKRKDEPGLIEQTQIAALGIYKKELDVILPELEKLAKGGFEFPEPSAAATANLKEYNTFMGALGDAAAKSAEQVGRLGIALTNAFSGLVGGKGDVAKKAISELTTSTGGAGGGFASGGFVRGPGSGTSDSIMARLSNGEFVLNAGSVSRLGVGFLQGLNNFALGGLVGAPPIRFAEGGLVSAASSSGRPVHLHLGGSSFALSGSSDVVDALVSHAHAQQIRSAGVKPSWFAGRPSGR